MDPFAEKDLIDMLKSIALSLREIRAELADLNVAVRELAVEETEDIGDEDGEEEIEEVEEGIEFEEPEEDKESDSGILEL